VLNFGPPSQNCSGDLENCKAIVEKTLRDTKGIMGVGWIDDRDRQKIRQFEEELQKRGLGGLGKYCNEGVLKVLGRQMVCVVLNNNDFRHATEPCLSWEAGDVVIGEEVSDPERLKSLQRSERVKVIGKNFVVFLDRIKKTAGQQPTFVFRALAFPEIEGIPRIKDVISASPLGAADLYLKERFGWECGKPELGTILIGFNLAPLTVDVAD
jgi:hypothetical protein